MKNVHLAPEADEDDLYSGYNDYNPTFDTEVKYTYLPIVLFFCIVILWKHRKRIKKE